MTPDLAELKRIAEAATQSEWSVGDKTRFQGVEFIPVETGNLTVCEVHGDDGVTVDAIARVHAAHIATFDPPTCLALIAENAAQAARIEALEAESRDLTKALTGLTCGGSEFFIRKGERYVADIKACVEWVQRRDRVSHDRIMKVTAERDEARTRAANLIGDRHE